MTERVITFASPICSLRNFSSGSSTQMIAFCTYKQQFTITCKTYSSHRMPNINYISNSYRYVNATNVKFQTKKNSSSLPPLRIHKLSQEMMLQRSYRWYIRTAKPHYSSWNFSQM